MGSYGDLKYVRFVKLIEVKFLVMVSNIYDFFKDNAYCLKKTVGLVENKVASIMDPVNKMITTLCEYKLGFIDEKFDNYAPNFMKNLVDKLNSFIEEKIAFVENVFRPLVHKAKTLLEKGLSTIESLVQKCINVKKSIFKELVSRTEFILEGSLDIVKQGLDKIKVVVGGMSIIGDATQSIIIIRIDTIIQFIETTTISIKEYGIFGSITSVFQHVLKETQATSASIFQKGFDYVRQVLDTTTSVVGSIPIIGEVAQSIISKQIDIASQLINTTTSSIKENGIFGTITKVTEHVVNEAQITGSSIIQKGVDSTIQVLDTTKWVVGGIPIIGDTAQSIITKQTDIASQMIENTTSSIKENGIFGTISSISENVLKEAQEKSVSIIQKGSESISQALETTKVVAGGIPIIGDTTQSIISKQTELASQLIETTTSSIKENGVFGTIASITDNLVNGAQETSTSIIQKGYESASEVLNTTKSFVGGIPIIGEATQSIITKQTELANQVIGTTTSSIKENGIFGAITSATERVVKEAQATGASIIEKGSESVSQTLETTKSVVGGIPIIGDVTQSIIDKQANTASQLIESTTTSIKEKGIFGAITSAAENVVKEAKETSSSIIQKSTESASQVLDTTKTVVGGIPIFGDAAQSIITKQTDMASQLINSTSSSYTEKGIFGAISSATEQIVKEAKETSSSILQKSTESASQALEKTKSVVGGMTTISDATQSIITKQTNMASELINSTSSSYKENGIFGAITSATEHVVKEAKQTSSSMIQKSTESASQALETTKSVVGGMPIIGDAAQSIITKQTEMANELINTTTSSYKDSGIFGAISAATNHVVKEAQATSESIIQKSSDSANQALETTKSVVGGIPIVGNAAQAIITKQTDMASKVVKKSTSSVKKHGLFGALVSLGTNVVKDAEKTTKSIVKHGSQSIQKNLRKKSLF